MKKAFPNIDFFRFLALLSLFGSGLYAQIDFKAPLNISCGSVPHALAIGDVNNDGLEDLIVGLSGLFDPQNDYRIKVYLQTASGQLGSPVVYHYPATYRPLTAMDLADMNGDSLNDVIITFGNRVGVYIQKQDGTLKPIQSFYSGLQANSVKAGDIDGDGFMDMVTGHEDESRLRIFKGKGNMAFDTSSVPKPAGSRSGKVEIGDVNGDGLLDVLAINQDHHSGLYVYTQKPGGGLNAYVRYRSGVGGTNGGMDLADVNNDGLLDVVVAKSGSGGSEQVLLWKQNPQTGLLEASALAAHTNIAPVLARDLNCDGRPELVTLHTGYNNMSVYEQDQAGQYGAIRNWFVRTQIQLPQSIAIGDINNDSKPDVVVANWQYGLYILYNEATPDTNRYVVQQSHSFTDTIASTQRDSSFYSTNFRSDTTQNGLFVFTQLDSFKISYTFLEDSIRHTTMDIVTATQCGNSYTDTLFQYNYEFNSKLLALDSVLIFSKKDTLSRIKPDTTTLLAEIMIYPNPVFDLLKVELPGAYLKNSLRVTVRDMQGRLLLLKTLGSGSAIREIPFDRLPVGAYVVDFLVGEEQIRKKIIKL